jgi:hypothetical protein
VQVGIAASTDISAARYVVRRTVVRRGPMGRRVVTKPRVCR